MARQLKIKAEHSSQINLPRYYKKRGRLKGQNQTIPNLSLDR